MKFFSVIFSLYIIILSCLPCGDRKECKVLDNGKETFAQIANHDNQEDTDSCSPFCTCACCGSAIVFSFQCPVSMTDIIPSFYPLNERIILKNDFFASNFYGSVWQPPKI